MYSICNIVYAIILSIENENVSSIQYPSGSIYISYNLRGTKGYSRYDIGKGAYIDQSISPSSLYNPTVYIPYTELQRTLILRVTLEPFIQLYRRRTVSMASFSNLLFLVISTCCAFASI